MSGSLMGYVTAMVITVLEAPVNDATNNSQQTHHYADPLRPIQGQVTERRVRQDSSTYGPKSGRQAHSGLLACARNLDYVKRRSCAFRDDGWR